MHLKRYMAMVLMTMCLCIFSFPAWAKSAEEPQLSLVPQSDSVDGKVNDPVSKKALRAMIFSDNPEFRIDSTVSSVDTVDVIVYSNEYVEGEDRGTRNRVMKKTVSVGENFSLLPEEIYDDAAEDGSLYDFVNRCFVLRVFTDESDSQYDDYYIGIVDENIFDEMSEAQEERKAAIRTKNAMMGPAAMAIR